MLWVVSDFGLYLRGHWCAEQLPLAWLENDVTGDLTFLELFPLVMMVHIWASEFQNSTI